MNRLQLGVEEDREAGDCEKSGQVVYMRQG